MKIKQKCQSERLAYQIWFETYCLQWDLARIVRKVREKLARRWRKRNA